MLASVGIVQSRKRSFFCYLRAFRLLPNPFHLFPLANSTAGGTICDALSAWPQDDLVPLFVDVGWNLTAS